MSRQRRIAAEPAGEWGGRCEWVRIGSMKTDDLDPPVIFTLDGQRSGLPLAAPESILQIGRSPRSSRLSPSWWGFSMAWTGPPRPRTPAPVCLLALPLRPERQCPYREEGDSYCGHPGGSAFSISFQGWGASGDHCTTERPLGYPCPRPIPLSGGGSPRCGPAPHGTPAPACVGPDRWPLRIGLVQVLTGGSGRELLRAIHGGPRQGPVG